MMFYKTVGVSQEKRIDTQLAIQRKGVGTYSTYGTYGTYNSWNGY